MEIIDIVMIVIGLGIIVGSYLISDQKADNENGGPRQIRKFEPTKEERDQLLTKVKTMLEQASTDVIDQTEEELNQQSNEKIMAVHEYSEQILEKIKQNHDEVVFLYNMLNDKEEELKTLLHTINYAEQELKNPEAMLLDEAMRGLMNEEEDIDSDNTEMMNQAYAMGNQRIIDDSVTQYDHSKEILDLYQRGKSIMEISKQLNIGQGEVQLVINLNRGGKA